MIYGIVQWFKQVLGLDSTATRETINDQYFYLVHQYHPDSHRVRMMNSDDEKKEAELRYMEINAAYKKLLEIEKRGWASVHSDW